MNIILWIENFLLGRIDIFLGIWGEAELFLGIWGAKANRGNYFKGFGENIALFSGIKGAETPSGPRWSGLRLNDGSGQRLA